MFLCCGDGRHSFSDVLRIHQKMRMSISTTWVNLYVLAGSSRPTSRTCIIFDLKLWKILLIFTTILAWRKQIVIKFCFCVSRAGRHKYSNTHSHISIQWQQKILLCTGLSCRCRSHSYFIDGCKMTWCQFGVGRYSVPFNRNKCLLLIDTAWFKNKSNTIIQAPRTLNRLRGVHHFWWQLGWKTWTPEWSYD